MQTHQPESTPRVEGVRIPCRDAQPLGLANDRPAASEPASSATPYSGTAPGADGTPTPPAAPGDRQLKLAALYARVSTDKREKEETIASRR